ncbi:hypothetical protein EV426DRAFT_301688 [Tirmania nivea]|nr:hypothetical protein EV426DRAFT_301688 [Tirmania nivea]
MISRSFLWIRCLQLLCVAIWVFPLASMAILVTDDDAAKKNLDSIYIGTVIATLNSTSKPTSCFPANVKFGPFASSRLTLGPVHNGWYEANTFFLQMVGGEQGKFLTSVQSSLTSTQSNETWWSLQAWQRGGTGKSDYEVHGVMVKDVNEAIGEERNQLSGVWEAKSTKLVRGNNKLEPLNKDGRDGRKQLDLCAKGTKHLLTWRHKKATTSLVGQVGAQQAEIVVTGIVVLTLGSTNPTNDHDDDKQKRNRLVRRQDTQQMAYTIIFNGKHEPESAPLPMQGLVWEKPGSGPPIKPFQFFTMELPMTTTSSAASTDTKTAVIPTATFKNPIEPGEKEDPPSKQPLGHGAIVGIVVGGVLAIVVIIIMLFLLKQWLAKRKEPNFYPELAYIYSTPFTSVNKRSQNAADCAGASSATFGTSRGASAHNGKYYGPAAPQLEVDLGDQVPFLPAAAAVGFPGRSRGGPSRIGTSSGAEGREEMEREMSEPMLSGAGTRREESPVRSRGMDFGEKF